MLQSEGVLAYHFDHKPLVLMGESFGFVRFRVKVL